MELQKVIDGLTKGQEILSISERLKYLSDPRLKDQNSIPFSNRLNEWLNNWYISQLRKGTIINFVDEDDFDETDIEATFQRHLKNYYTKVVINVWTGASDNTIYGDQTINHIARAWHDHTHFTSCLGYSPIEEIKVAKIQAAQLPQDWWYEKALIEAEVSGQVLYFQQYSKFPENQRKFVLNQLLTGTI